MGKLEKLREMNNTINELILKMETYMFIEEIPNDRKNQIVLKKTNNQYYL